MRRFLSTLVLASLLVTTFPATIPATFAQRAAEKGKKSATTQRGVDTIAANQMKDYLTFIASDEMEGRDTPSRGLDTTAKFLAMNLSRWGFKPAGDNGTFFQSIDLLRYRTDGGRTKAEFNDKPLNLGTDFVPSSSPGTVSGQLVFAGNGWFMKSKQFDAYKDINPAGRIAVIFAIPGALPRGATRADLSGKSGEDFMNPVEYARSKGVTGLIWVADSQYPANFMRNRQRLLERGSVSVAKFQPATTTPSVPSIVISMDAAKALFEGEKDAESILSSGGATLPAPFLMNDQKKMMLNVASNTETVPTQNVVAVWEGSDPALKSEYVALGSHYDHVGSGCPPNGDDRICNGADDDGSGTTAMLAMAEALAKAPTRPKRSVLFVWHCGEEKGLWGSRYFVEFPTVPLNAIVAQINMDMIGRAKADGDTNTRNKDLSGPNSIYLIGSTMMSTELGEVVNTVNKSYLNLTFDTRYDDPKDPNRFFYRSDHYNYARKGIPIIFFFDGVHEDYHRAGDTADKIDYQKMEKVTRTIYMTTWEIANRAARLKVDKPLPAQITIS